MLRGLIAATFTPLHADGSLHLERVPVVVRHLLGQGLGGVFVCGSTGEGASLTVRERMQVAEAYVEALAGALPVLVHVGHDSLAEARALAQHARETGVHAIAATPPSYFPLHETETIVACLAQIAESAPELPLYYYHIPRLTGVAADVPRMLELAAERLPSLAGVKYSDPSFDVLQLCVRDHGERLNFLFGVDEMLLSGLVAGAHGAVGSTYNYFGPLFGRVLEAFAAGDLETARRAQGEATERIQAILRQAPPLSALKATMAIAGTDCGPPRLPLRPLTSEQTAELASDLRALGWPK